jgi:hypothetical protein
MISSFMEESWTKVQLIAATRKNFNVYAFENRMLRIFRPQK